MPPSAAPPIAPLRSRRVAASRGQYRWCGGGGSLHRPAAGAAITSMRGGCRRLVWLEAYAAPPKPYCRSSAWRLGRAAVVVADGIWRRRRRLALPSGRNSDPAALAGVGAYTFLLNGYPCLLCPCVVCFKFLQPKVIEGKKIDCALADPHLPRLLGGAPQLFTANLVHDCVCRVASARATRRDSVWARQPPSHLLSLRGATPTLLLRRS